MLTIKAEASPGQDVAEAIEDLCILASRLGSMVTVTFNGVGLTAKPGADPRELLAKWEELRDSNRPFKYACAQPVELPRAWQAQADVRATPLQRSQIAIYQSENRRLRADLEAAGYAEDQPIPDAWGWDLSEVQILK